MDRITKEGYFPCLIGPCTHKTQDECNQAISEELDLRWGEGESAISGCKKLELDLKCLEESTVDKKAWDKLKEEIAELKAEKRTTKLNLVSLTVEQHKAISRLNVEITTLKAQVEEFEFTMKDLHICPVCSQPGRWRCINVECKS